MNESQVDTRPVRRLRAALLLVLSFMVVEVLGGILTNSLALLSDAAHMLMDAAALGIAMLAAVVSRRGSDVRRTYGYRRVEILGGLANSLLLLVLVAVIVRESIERLQAPPAVLGAGMSAVAVLGLAVNLLAMRILHPIRHSGVNIQGAFLHVLGDTLGSISALIAGVTIWLFGWRIMDPIAGILVAGIVLVGSLRLLKECLHILLEGTPSGVDLQRLQDRMCTVPGVRAIHDVHVWSIGGGFDVLTAHVVAEEPQRWHQIRREIKDLVGEFFGIRHVTLQMEESGGDRVCTSECETADRREGG